MLKDYPDVMSVRQVAEALHLCDNSVYRLIREGQLGCKKVKRKILVPKICVIDYLTSARYTVNHL